MKTLNIGLVGYGFMGRTHSNAFLQAPRFFDVPFEPVLKAVCARNPDRVNAFASNWGYESVETDWNKLRKTLCDITTGRRKRLPHTKAQKFTNLVGGHSAQCR